MPARNITSKIAPISDDISWAATPGYMRIEANAQLLVDNLLDYTHVAHLHRNTISGDPREATTPTKTERLNDGIRVGRWMIDFIPPPLFARAGGFHFFRFEFHRRITLNVEEVRPSHLRIPLCHTRAERVAVDRRFNGRLRGMISQNQYYG
jgi:phenylpropionate dioxygenase-like ring-hydroxylating dioxygenase large terminal subunit